MKAVIINPYWDTLGGGERYTATVIEYLLSRKVTTDIIWPENISSQIFRRFALNIKAARFLPQYQPSGYDLAFVVSDGSVPLPLAKRTLIHLQFPFQNIGGHTLPNLIKSRLSTFVVNSRFTKSYIDKEYWVNSHVVYPPVDVTSFTPGKKTKVILNVSRFSDLTQHKGHSLLIDAFHHLHSQLPGWKLVLAGGVGVGTDSQFLYRLRHQAKNLPVEFVINPDFSTLSDLYSTSSIFWSASGFSAGTNPLQMEHFGISVVESMASGCVPLVVNKGGFPEIVDSGQNGYLWNELDDLPKLTLEVATHSSRLSYLSANAVRKSKMFSKAAFFSSLNRIINL